MADQDAIDKILAADPNANIVQSDATEIWLMTGDNVKVAEEAVKSKSDRPAAS
jgi:hypothetical protein